MKIAFCFLIYDEILHEELWHNFFKDADPNKYTIYIHYKTNKPLKYFEQYKLPNCIPTEWANVSLIHAHNLLFRTAFETDKANYKFINVSGSCIPLKSFDYVYHFLTKDDFGYFNLFPIDGCYPRCNSLLKHIDQKHISKASEWFILNRWSVKVIAYLNKPIINHLYQNMNAPDEVFFITTLKQNRMDHLIKVTDHLPDGATTFNYWTDMNYRFKDDSIPMYTLKNFDTITEDEMRNLLQSPSLFGRKFNKNCIIQMNALVEPMDNVEPMGNVEPMDNNVTIINELVVPEPIIVLPEPIVVLPEPIIVLSEPINFCTFISNNLAGSSREYSGVDPKLLPVVVRQPNPKIKYDYKSNKHNSRNDSKNNNQTIFEIWEYK